MNKIKITSVDWNFTEHRPNNSVAQRLKTSPKQASLVCTCGEEWIWKSSSTAVASSIVGECPNCKMNYSFERAEFASL